MFSQWVSVGKTWPDANRFEGFKIRRLRTSVLPYGLGEPHWVKFSSKYDTFLKMHQIRVLRNSLIWTWSKNLNQYADPEKSRSIVPEIIWRFCCFFTFSKEKKTFHIFKRSTNSGISWSSCQIRFLVVRFRSGVFLVFTVIVVMLKLGISIYNI